MNNIRRKQISAISEQIEKLKMDIEALKYEEQECFDNLPESLQASERGSMMEAAIEALEYASDDLDECLDHLMEASE